jgi:hypothetical protein
MGVRENMVDDEWRVAWYSIYLQELKGKWIVIQYSVSIQLR